MLLVLAVKVVAALLLREIQVSIGDSAEQNRHTKEGAHRRVIWRKADRARILAQVVEAERTGVADQDSEDAAPARQVADGPMRLRVDAVRHEAL